MSLHLRSRLLRTLPALPLALATGCTRSSSSEAVPQSTPSAAIATSAVPDGGGAATCKPLGESAASKYRIRYDQLGYTLDGRSPALPEPGRNEGTDRFAVVMSSGAPAPHYKVRDATTQCVVAEGTAGPRVLQANSRAGTPLTGDRIDLSKLAAGRYLVALEDGSWVGPIVMGKDVYAPILPLVARFLGEQRCGPTTKSVSIHDACHLFQSIGPGAAHSGDGVVVDDGAHPPYRSTKSIDVEGGWHDAGDYIKFVGTTSYVLAVDLMALRDNGAALGAPGRELAGELRWGLDWLLKMVAGAEPLHQVGGEGDHDPDWRIPEGDTAKPIPAYDARPVFRMAKGKGRNLLGRSAAAFAFGSQVYADDAAYSQKLLAAARAAYLLAKARPGVQNPDPPDFYPEKTGDDDLVFAAGALARVTGDASYATDAYTLGKRLASAPGTIVGWGSIDALALLEAARAFPPESHERAELAHQLTALAAPIAATATTPVGPGGAFGYALPALENGSIAESLGAAVTCLASRRLGGTPSGTDPCGIVARRQLHWLLGENPFGLSFLVGAGTAFPHDIHHSFGQAAHVTIPGTIPGGPSNIHTLEESKLPLPPKTDTYAAWSTDELLYEDKADDYVCNEPAIDFTAGLVFILAELAGD
jgi:hypothetical protein